jgi:16S rRNA processing protein RimM
MIFFCLGKIIKTRGLHGCLKVVSYVQKISVIADLEYIYIENLLGKKNKYKIKKTDISGKFLFIELDGIADRKTAESLIGRKVFLPKSFFPELSEGEYY